MKLLTILLVVPMIGVLCQGCVAFPYPTPEVRGLVIDATTKQPIAGARVEIRRHTHIFCETAADGSFDLHAAHTWEPCFLIPGDYLIFARLSFKAPGYYTATNTAFQGSCLLYTSDAADE